MKFMRWKKPPQTCLLVVRIPNPELRETAPDLQNAIVQLSSYLTKRHTMKVYAENIVKSSFSNDLSLFLDEVNTAIDLVITLGGDGTLLYATSLFQKVVPVFLTFHLGTLGFLISHGWDPNTCENLLSGLLSNERALSVMLRSRLRARLLRLKEGHEPKVILENHLLNDVVIDRGSRSSIIELRISVNSKHITVVKGDGLIVSTPSGSTAYALSAGASVVHPSVPCILITPICPHSLSFRPLILPADVKLEISPSKDCRTTPSISCDGVSRMLMDADSRLEIDQSPAPITCLENPKCDWFDSINQCLNWNMQNNRRKENMVSCSANVESKSSAIPRLNSSFALLDTPEEAVSIANNEFG